MACADCTEDKAITGVPPVEVYPVCEHRFRVEDPEGDYCWVCGESLEPLPTTDLRR